MGSTLPFTIQKFVFQPDRPVEIVNMDDPSGDPGKVPGFFVMSSAPPNIEEAEETSDDYQQQAHQGVKAIVGHLRDMMASYGSAELVIAVHGYNTSRGGVQTWYKGIFKYINRHDPNLSRQPNRIFIGYRWPSENVKLGKVGEALSALPPLPRDLLLVGGFSALGLLVLNFLTLGQTPWGFGLSLILALLFILGMLMLALVVLRLVVYFRDHYRANNFGVLDLVELLRQIDLALVQHTADEMFPDVASRADQRRAMAQARGYWRRRSRPKVKLSFVGHSMGGFVVTNVIRILSDVFDDGAVAQHPESDVGDVFRLERLILASPDIPVLTIISSRANVLASSLRRFSESYLFCSEGDIALRIASTAANYIAFPSKTQARGYRLGNVALQNEQGSSLTYGITNLRSLDQDFPPHLPIGEAIAQMKTNVMEALFVTFQRFQRQGVVTLADLFKAQADGDSTRATVADFFTYFDCTDYVDSRYDPEDNTCSANATGILTRAKGKAALKSWDYFLLTLDYATGKRDVHGGYFEGQFSQQLLYGLAFLGFKDYLKTLAPDDHVALSQLHLTLEEKGIQGFLSPIRYRVDIQGGSLEGTMTDLMDAIETNQGATHQETPPNPSSEGREQGLENKG